jgi:hypothetical protein
MFQVKRLPCCCAAVLLLPTSACVLLLLLLLLLLEWDGILVGRQCASIFLLPVMISAQALCAYMLLLPLPLLSSVLQVHCGRRLQTKCLLLRSVCVRITLMLPVQHCQQRLWRAALYLVRYDFAVNLLTVHCQFADCALSIW